MLIDKYLFLISSLGSEFPKRKDIKIIDTKYVFYGLVSPQIFRKPPPPGGMFLRMIVNAYKYIIN